MKLNGTRVFATVSLLALPALVLAAGKLSDNAKDAAKALEGGKTNLSKVIEAAEAATKGKAVAVMATKKDANVVFAVHCAAEGKCKVAHVDGAGKAGEVKDGSADDCKGWADSTKMMDAAKMGLTKAVAAAEADTKGMATSASSDGNGFMVAVVADGKVWNVTVGKDGKVGKKDEEKPAPKPGG